MMDEGLLRAAALGGFWTALDVVASTGSTNADLLARAAADAAVPEGQVLVAEEQTAGRGRRAGPGRACLARALTFSVLLRPVTVPAERRGWLPLIAGVAVASAVRSVTGRGGSGGGASGRGGSGGAVDAVLKWPNDVLVGGTQAGGPPRRAVTRRVGGGDRHRLERGDTRGRASGLPGLLLRRRHCWSRALPCPVRALLLEILRQFESWYTAFLADPDPARTGLLDAYRPLCVTLGQRVRVELPVGRFVSGVATGVDHDGRLLVADNPGDPPMAISAGDVVHVRP